MDNAELGRRLKSARLAKKMTQSDVVGSFITRNMLSQIESGTATPSMKTLEYLSGVLDLPLEKLLSESGGTESEQSSLAALRRAKQLLEEEQYEEVLRVEDASGLIADELHALRSMAHLEIARSLAETQQTESMQTAVMHARYAAQEAGKGLYANKTRAGEANLLISQIAKFLSDYYSSLAAGKQ